MFQHDDKMLGSALSILNSLKNAQENNRAREFLARIKAGYIAANLAKSQNFSNTTVVLDSKGKEHKRLKQLVLIKPSGKGTPLEQYHDSLALVEFIKQHFGPEHYASSNNILVQPPLQGEAWHEINRFHGADGKVIVENTIDPDEPVGTIAIRGRTIQTMYLLLFCQGQSEVRSMNYVDSLTKHGESIDLLLDLAILRQSTTSPIGSTSTGSEIGLTSPEGSFPSESESIMSPGDDFKGHNDDFVAFLNSTWQITSASATTTLTQSDSPTLVAQSSSYASLLEKLRARKRLMDEVIQNTKVAEELRKESDLLIRQQQKPEIPSIPSADGSTNEKQRRTNDNNHRSVQPKR